MTKIMKPNINNPTILQPVHPAIESYLAKLTGQSGHPVVTAMEARANQYNFPIVGRLVGMFLETMAKTINAKRIFEFGSGFGYSAFWFARAIDKNGTLICTDTELENQQLAEQYLNQAGLWSQVDFQIGYAQQIFEGTEGDFDICYNDVDKGDYPEVWLMARGRIRPGGLYIADNVLWHGRVAIENPVDIVPGWTEAILEHNRLIFEDPDFDAFINPIRDGVIIARRK